MRAPLAERANGRWRAILPALGVGADFLTGKHGPCPMCGGKDRWRFIDRRGSGDWHCNSCGHGSGVDLVMRVLKLEFRAAAERIEAVIGDAPRAERKPGNPRAQRRAMAMLWNAGTRLTRGDAAALYLARRGIALDHYPACLRLATARYDAARSFPTMLAQVISPEGKAVQLHRTYLDGHGGKASVEPARKLMPGEYPPGSAVRLAALGPTLGIAEGIETALAAAQIFRHPVWAALNAANLERFEPPIGVERLVIYGDNDANHAGQAAAYALGRRLSAKLATEVRIPSRAGDDWNDVLRQQMEEVAA